MEQPQQTTRSCQPDACRRYKVQDSVVLSGKSLKQIAKQRNRDGLGDLTQSEQSRLQEIIELRSKFEEAISRLLKKMSDTNSGIIDKIK